MARSTGIPQRLRGYDSWVDIPSQSSSSPQSLSNNDIVTTGLCIQKVLKCRRRRRRLDSSPPTAHESRGTSSQEEYEESESDEDHVLTSSNEHIAPKSLAITPFEADSDSDRFESSKNWSVGNGNTRTPSSMQHNSASPLSNQNIDMTSRSFPPMPVNLHDFHASRNPLHQNSYTHSADQDAALRSSLNTLLSIGAAAARGLPVREKSPNRLVTSEGGRTLNQPIDFRIVSESELMASSQQQSSTLVPKAMGKCASNNTFMEKTRKNMVHGGNSRTLRKNQSELHESVPYPGFLTLAVSASVLVLVGVVGFGAGYIFGREVGRREAIAGLGASSLSEGSSSGRETFRSTSEGLKRLKWSISGGSRGVTTQFLS